MLPPQTQTQSHSDHNDACGIAQRWNDDCEFAQCGTDDYARDFLMRLKSLQTTDNNQPDSAGSTGGGLKILLPE